MGETDEDGPATETDDRRAPHDWVVSMKAKAAALALEAAGVPAESPEGQESSA